VDTPQPADAPAEETFAQVLDALKREYGVKEPAISDRIGVHVSTVNKWTNGKSTPRPDTVRDLARYFPKLKKRLLAAAQIRVPAPLPPDRRQVMLEVMDRLTEEQQELMLIQGMAWADSNDGKV
jgi:transcriptional regulator with XRE-family HTH domain